VLKSTCS